MYAFLNDYSESAHPDILNALQATHTQQYSGYGFDEYSEQVKQTLRHQLNNDDLAIHFSMTGTQANLVCIASMLRPIDGIIACNTGHIAVNEAGAIEATGHKVILADEVQGKLTIDAVDTIRKRHSFMPHVVRAKAIYLSNTTELGTVYTRSELKALYDYCQAHDMYVFMDGARLGAALASDHQDMTLADIAKYTDMFWLGGTKMGAMFGEIIIIPNTALATDFNIHLKQHGGLMAKGYLLALQFVVLLKNNKYLDICRHANAMASQIAKGIEQAGYTLYVPTQSNQVFALLPQALISYLLTEFQFYEWENVELGTSEQPNPHSIVRLVTSWATPQTQVDRFITVLNNNDA